MRNKNFKVINCKNERKKCGFDISYFLTNNFWIDVTILLLNLVFYGLFNGGTGGKLTDFLNIPYYQVRIFFYI